ncbi:UDP-forming cellulose synthase catalytic subunit [Antarcticirhabdus aurantiaca]|uniref:UDP-forming cellulose synthase catalytic subunit n=1 Tax=Antarcticirhabdus aurantiaca TaxID=2606717 RepID=A0ACD4NPT0_9HYPH|nr:UDP-forming cellulose synthase catalytic subunit [Antarcticirhabdus aurantiaca]WAJ28799.1 UDP-forming cellulose synthase catalytic subunit [Jeongeuplla avenae]
MLRLGLTVLWIVASIVAIAVITLPVSLQAQLFAVLFVLGVMVVLKVFDLGGVWRLVALALGTSIVLRYVYWRTTSTLPPVNQLENFIPGFLLYLAEMYSVFMLALSLFVVAAPVPPRPSRGLPADLRPPTVDVFIPSYNEPPKLLANTIASALAMNYPADRFTVWLLDDGSTDQKRTSEDAAAAMVAEARHAELKRLCEDMGARYLTRARNEHAKAGNLNNGMLHSTGELIAVFDADHAPAHDFLAETVGYFEDDPRLFLVQTPHFFLNPDPLERNLRTFETMPSENEMFYGIIQRGLDKWNASFFCGSAALLRREALNETSGFSGISITEDCETAIELHSRGWNSLYVDKPLIAGLQPATFASFIGQRSRWAQGMMQILFLRVPLLKRGLSLPQRLCYMSSTLFWLFPFPRLMFLIAPLFYLFFGLQIFTASSGEFVAYTLTYMAVNLMMQNYMYGAYRWPWISELYEYVQSVHLLPAVVSTILHPKKPTFNVTAKDESIVISRISEIGLPFYLIFAVLLAGVGATVWRVIYEPYRADLTLVVGAWNVLNLLIAGCALGVVSERGTPSASRRVSVRRRCDVVIGDTVLTGTIEDVSVSGARIRVAGALPFETERDGPALLRLRTFRNQEEDTIPLRIRRIERGTADVVLGCAYVTETARHHRVIADLIFANSGQWDAIQKSRRRNPGLLRGSAWFFAICIYQTFRGLAYLTKGRSGRPAPASAPAQAPAGGR